MPRAVDIVESGDGQIFGNRQSQLMCRVIYAECLRIATGKYCSWTILLLQQIKRVQACIFRPVVAFAHLSVVENDVMLC